MQPPQTIGETPFAAPQSPARCLFVDRRGEFAVERSSLESAGVRLEQESVRTVACEPNRLLQFTDHDLAIRARRPRAPQRSTRVVETTQGLFEGTWIGFAEGHQHGATHK